MILILKSSISQMFLKLGVHKNFAIFTGKPLCWSLFLTKLQALKRDSNKGLLLWILRIDCRVNWYRCQSKIETYYHHDGKELGFYKIVHIKTFRLSKKNNILVMSEVIIRRCSVKKVFLEISQNSQESNCTRISFLIRQQALGLQLY